MMLFITLLYNMGVPSAIPENPSMVGRRRNATTTQSLRRRREPFLVLRRVYVSGPITALAAASPRRKVKNVGRRTSGPCGGRKEGL